MCHFLTVDLWATAKFFKEGRAEVGRSFETTESTDLGDVQLLFLHHFDGEFKTAVL